MKDYYEILQVHPKASLDIIKKAYITLAKKYHPDTTELDAATAQQMMKDLNEAYAVLSDASRREAYDQKMRNYARNQDSSGEEEEYQHHYSWMLTVSNFIVNEIETKIIHEKGHENDNYVICQQLLSYFEKSIQGVKTYAVSHPGKSEELLNFIGTGYMIIAREFTWGYDFIKSLELIKKAGTFLTVQGKENLGYFKEEKEATIKAQQQQEIIDKEGSYDTLRGFKPKNATPNYTASSNDEPVKSNKWLYIGIVAAIILGYFFFGGNTKSKPSSYTAKSSSNSQQSKGDPVFPPKQVEPVYITKYVNSYDVNVRRDPSTNNDPLGVYDVPEAVKVISQEGQWTKVQRNDGSRTYIFSKFLSDDPTVAQDMAKKEIIRNNLAYYIDKKDEFDRQIAAFSNEVNGLIGKPNSFYQAARLADRMWKYTNETIPNTYNSLKRKNVRLEDQYVKALILDMYAVEQERVGFMYNGLTNYMDGGSYKQEFSKGTRAYNEFQELNRELNNLIN